MKKSLAAVLIAALLSFLSACALQKNMSPEIFLERLTDENDAFFVNFDERFYESGRRICFVGDEGGTEYAVSMSVAEDGNVIAVEAASSAADKEKAFIALVESIIEVYSPDDDVKAIIDGLFPDGAISDRCVYYNTQWHEYSAFGDENGFFFSADDLSLGEHTVPDLTLGDLSGYMNKTKRP